MGSYGLIYFNNLKTNKMKKFWFYFWYMLSIINGIVGIWCLYEGILDTNFLLWALVCILCASREEHELEIKELKEKLNKYE